MFVEVQEISKNTVALKTSQAGEQLNIHIKDSALLLLDKIVQSY